MSCPLCASHDARHRTTEGGFDIVECRHCSMLYVHPMPSHDVGKVEFGGLADADEHSSLIVDKQRVSRGCLDELSRQHPSGGYLVDIGSGFGVLLDMARDRGWTAVGLELSPGGARASRVKSDCPVICGSVVRLPLACGSVRAVTMWNVLEHLHDPKRSLEEIIEVLEPETGTLVARVPNMSFHELLHRCGFLAGPLLRAMGKQLPPFLGGIAPPEHLLGFTPKTLRLVLVQAGFDNVQVKAGRSRSDSWGSGDHSVRGAVVRFANRAVAAITSALHIVTGGRVAITPTLEGWAMAPSRARRTGRAQIATPSATPTGVIRRTR